MYQFLFRRNDTRHSCLSHTFHLWRINCTPGNCLVDGNCWLDRPVKKFCSRKPDPVCGHHLSILPTLYLPIKSGPGEQPCRYYLWHFSMQGLPAINVTINSRRLLPYVFIFTLRSFSQGGLLFSVALSLSDYIGGPVFTRCIALCCPDFPYIHPS